MTDSIGIILPRTRSFQPMPVSTPPSMNQNSYNTVPMTGHSNRCVFVGITHIEKEEMSVTVACVIKIE